MIVSPTDLFQTIIGSLDSTAKLGSNQQFILSKTLFIVLTDAHYYKIIEMLKQYKITILAPTCFGSRSNHHQGAVLSVAKTTK